MKINLVKLKQKHIIANKKRRKIKKKKKDILINYMCIKQIEIRLKYIVNISKEKKDNGTYQLFINFNQFIY